jgi:hypothetical protein
MPRSSSGQNDGRSNQSESSNQGGRKSERGLASASKSTRERVAKKGGEASHGGGRNSGSRGSSREG